MDMHPPSSGSAPLSAGTAHAHPPCLGLAPRPQTQGLQQLPQLNGKAYADLPRSGPSPSQQAFGNFTLTSTCFQSMSQEAILRL